jgi:hypothetical protein
MYVYMRGDYLSRLVSYSLSFSFFFFGGKADGLFIRFHGLLPLPSWFLLLILIQVLALALALALHGHFELRVQQLKRHNNLFVEKEAAV